MEVYLPQGAVYHGFDSTLWFDFPCEQQEIAHSMGAKAILHRNHCKHPV